MPRTPGACTLPAACDYVNFNSAHEIHTACYSDQDREAAKPNGALTSKFKPHPDRLKAYSKEILKKMP
jgi:hypothetical protein